MPEKLKNKVLLLGDTSVDLFILHGAPQPKLVNHGEGPDWVRHTQWLSWMRPGGVHMTRDFLRDLVDFEIDMYGPDRRDGAAVSRLGSLVTLMYVEEDGDGGRIVAAKPPFKAGHTMVRIDQMGGYQDIAIGVAKGQPIKHDQGIGPTPVFGESDYQVRQNVPVSKNYEAVVFNDAGADLRDESGKALVDKAFSVVAKAQNQTPKDKPRFVLLKTHLPMCKGHVWTSFGNSASENKDVAHIVLVSADDLRENNVEINHCLSWDAVVDDIAKAATTNETMQRLLAPGCHVVILFDVEGAIWLQKSDDQISWAIMFCPAMHEGQTMAENAGTLLGRMNCFSAHLCNELLNQSAPVDPDKLAEACRTALSGLSDFARQPMRIESRGQDASGIAKFGPLKYPKLSKAKKEKKNGYLVHALDDLSSAGQGDRPGSRLMEDLIQKVYPQDGPYGLARDVISTGLRTLNSFPIGKFRKLTVTDRSEIESLRAINRLISDYLRNRDETAPLSIAVFGAPGAGKSFSVKQLVDKDEVPVCEFNMSEATAQDLPGFFHEIRDHNLTGRDPLCFFDEFDTDGRRLVSSFLAPMQDGQFRQGARIHPTGRGIFVFAGGTSETFEEFAAQDEDGDVFANGVPGHGDEPGQSFATLNRELKIPDFVSRLRGYLNIGGIDKRDGDSYLLRRAILLRVYIEEHMPSIIDQDKVAQIDEAVIDAFLGCESYVHGARSMEQIVKMSSRSSSMTRFTMSDLPEQRQLKVHADEYSFKNGF